MAPIKIVRYLHLAEHSHVVIFNTAVRMAVSIAAFGFPVVVPLLLASF